MARLGRRAWPPLDSGYDERFYDGVAAIGLDEPCSCESDGEVVERMAVSEGCELVPTVRVAGAGAGAARAAADRAPTLESRARVSRVSEAKRPRLLGSAHGLAGEVTHSWSAILFDSLRDPLAGDRIGPEGLFDLFARLDVVRGQPGFYLSSIAPLLLCWQLDAANFGVLRFHEWMLLDSLSIVSLEMLAELLDQLLESLCDPHEFTRFYRYCFAAHACRRKSVSLAAATEVWTMLLTPRYRYASMFLHHFLPSSDVKVITQDQWLLLPEFMLHCESPSWLLHYKFDAPWPVLFDAFVEYANRMNHLAG